MKNLAPCNSKLRIRWDIIEEQYEEMVKYTASQKGTAETDILLRRFSKGNSHIQPIALMELGRL